MIRPSFWRRTSDRWLLFAALFASILLMKADASAPMQSCKLRFLNVFTPIASHPIRTLAGFHSDAEIRGLKTELAERDLDSAMCHEIRLENRCLRALLDLRSRSPYVLFPAEILSRGARGLPGSVHLNVGSDQGCRRNLALIAGGCAAGRLAAAGRSASVGQLLNDPSSRISAMVRRSRVLGIVHWLYGNVFTLNGVPANSDVAVGDTVITSGYSDIYPKGLPVGHICEVRPDESGLFLDIRLYPAVDFSTLETVFVMLDTTRLNGDGS